MDWGRFFEDTRKAAGVDSFAKLAPMLHITDGAISHYRTGKRVPPAWTIAAALKIQGRDNAEKEAARIMREAAKSAEERAFWRKLGAAAAVAVVALGTLVPYPIAARSHSAIAETEQDAGLGIMRITGKSVAAPFACCLLAKTKGSGMAPRKCRLADAPT